MLHVFTAAAPAAAASASPGNPRVLERSGIGVLRGDTLQVASDGMTIRALRLEVSLTAGCVADQNIQRGWIDGSRRTCLRAYFGKYAMNVFGDGRYVGVIQIKRRHALVLASAANDRGDDFAVLDAKRGE